MRRTAGVTLMELLVAAIIVAGITAATTRALSAGFNSSKIIEASRASETERAVFEDAVTAWIRQAWLSPSATSTTCEFIGQVGPMSPGDPSQIITATTTAGGQVGTGPTSTSPTTSSGSGGGATSSDNPLSNSGNSDNLTFTAVGASPPLQLFTSTDDWETNNQNLGPAGGVAEVCLSLSGEDDPANHQGLFIRIQRPADDDPTQGGFEKVLCPDLSSIGYEFFDGQNWDPTWDTRTMTPRQLPAAVRVTYRFKNDKQDHVMVVALPYSNTTYENYVIQQ
jgi:type II secretory pathway pseudopilin PulG